MKTSPTPVPERFPSPPRQMIYEGSPSWKAYFGRYAGAGLCAVLLVGLLRALHGAEASLSTRLLDVAIPIAVAGLFMLGTTIWRRSMRFRVSTSAIELESGVVAKRIKVVQLARCSDVVYRQTVADKLLGIAHVDILTSDTVAPRIELVGVPARRDKFHQLRHAVEYPQQFSGRTPDGAGSDQAADDSNGRRGTARKR